MHAILIAALLSNPAPATEATAPAEVTPPAEVTSAPEVTPEAVTAVQDEEEPRGRWFGGVSLGASWTGGNSRTSGASGSLDAKYLFESGNRVTVKGLYEYQTSRDTTPEKIKDKYFLDGKYDHFMNERTYLWGQLRGEVDRVAGLKLRQIAGGGIGHQFYDTDTFQLSGEAGLSFIDEEFTNGTDNDYTAARIAYDLDYIPNDRWSFGQSTDYYPSLDDSDVWYVVVDNFAKVNLSEAMFGKLTYLFQHTETPPAGAKQDDHTVQLTVGWNF